MRWPTKSVESSVERLIDYRGKTPTKTSSGVRLITAKVIKGGRILPTPAEYIAIDQYDSWMRRGLPKKLDVLLTTEAPLGEIGILRTSEKVALAQRVILLRGKPGILDQRFMFYAMQDAFVQDQLHSRSTGTTVLGIKQSELRKVELPVPDLLTQGRIASTLSAYDDLIENNTRRIEILEEMARRLYEEWFVQFRFPGHEGVEFTDSSLGLIPVGWTVGCLQDVITLQRGFDLPVQHRLAGSVPIISATGIGGSHVEAKVKGPGVVTGRSGSIGKVMYVHDDHWPLNTTLWGANYPLGSTLFAYYVLSSIDLKGFNVGAAVPTLNRNDIHGLPVNIPPKEIVQSFEKVAEPLHNLTEKLRRKNANLRAQRDLLLPKLISGEIDVSDIPMPT